MIEMICGQHNENLESKVYSELIDLMHEQSIKKRINFVALFVHMTKPEEQQLLEAVAELVEFSKYYNKHLRDYRDFVAHNPVMISTDNEKIISSRRYKAKLDSVHISYLVEQNEVLISKIKEVFAINEIVFAHYPTEIVRDLS